MVAIYGRTIIERCVGSMMTRWSITRAVYTPDARSSQDKGGKPFEFDHHGKEEAVRRLAEQGYTALSWRNYHLNYQADVRIDMTVAVTRLHDNGYIVGLVNQFVA